VAPSEGTPEFSSIDICKLDKKPNTLSDKNLQTLLDDGDNVVLLDELTSLTDIKMFGTRGIMKKSEEIFTNASYLSNVYVPKASKEYTKCLTSPNPSPQ
jgi:hypothetical protein